jgi:hypothetical protein
MYADMELAESVASASYLPGGGHHAAVIHPVHLEHAEIDPPIRIQEDTPHIFIVGLPM